MTKKTLLCACVGGLMGLMASCGAKAQMPEGKLLRLEYRRSGSMAGFEYFGRVTTMKDSTIVLYAMRQEMGPLYRVNVDARAMDRLCEIIKEEKMYKYKQHYDPPVQVLDGYTWLFSAEFAGNQSIYSGGSNALPGGDGLERIRDLFKELVKSDAAEEIPAEDSWNIMLDR